MAGAPGGRYTAAMSHLSTDAGGGLSPGDPPPFEIVNPGAGRPLVLVCDHAGCHIPERLRRLGLDEAAAAAHIAWDIGAAELTRHLSGALDAVAVLGTYSRLLVDLNRTPHEPSAMPEMTCGVPIPGNMGLSEAVREVRRRALFRPYHAAVGTVIEGWRGKGIPPAVIGIHSFTPCLGERPRPWQVGVLWNRDGRLALPALRRLAREPGLTVGDNEPYSGQAIYYTLDTHAGAAGLPHVAFEVRQDELATAQGIARWAALLARVIAGLPDAGALATTRGCASSESQN